MNVEHRTSNVQHRIKKQTSNAEHSTTPRRGFFSAVLILVTKISINSSVSCKISSNSSVFLISGTRLISFNHLWVSLSYFNEILALVFVFHSTFDVGRSMFDVHPFFEQPFFQIICLFLHLFPFNVRCWTFDVRCSFFSVPPEEKQLSAYSAWKGLQRLYSMGTEPSCCLPLGCLVVYF